MKLFFEFAHSAVAQLNCLEYDIIYHWCEKTLKERRRHKQRRGKDKTNEGSRKGGVLGFCVGLVKARVKYGVWRKMNKRWGADEKMGAILNAVPIQSTWMPCFMFPPTPAYCTSFHLLYLYPPPLLISISQPAQKINPWHTTWGRVVTFSC